jgi:sporulation protein YlmC with PRC-barrel domain
MGCCARERPQNVVGLTSHLVAVFGLSIVAACGFGAPGSAEADQSKASIATPANPPTTQAHPVAKDAVAAVVIDDKDLESVLGQEIYGGNGEDMGRIVDILVDHKANVRAAIIDFGGFLGVGTRKIAVDWHALRFDQDRAITSLIRDQVRVAPEYKEGEPIVILGPGSFAPPHAKAPPQLKPEASPPVK